MTTFVGRDGDVRKVLALLEASRMVTLTGPGGVGKTRLALRAAGQLVGAAVDGVWWVDLTPLGEPTLLADAILSALEDQPGGRLASPRVAGTDPEDRLRSFLADRELLLVLDNCEHLAEAVGRLTGRNSGGRTPGTDPGHQPAVAEHRRGGRVVSAAAARATNGGGSVHRRGAGLRRGAAVRRPRGRRGRHRENR